MSSLRTSLAQTRVPANNIVWLTLLSGLIAGLFIGLIIGWVIWPVEWEGAYLSELAPETRAQYVAAVADGYVVYSSPEAAQVAIERLSALRSDLPQELNAAIQYFRQNPRTDSEIRIMNLSQLANALGVAASPMDANAEAAGESAITLEQTAAATSASSTSARGSLIFRLLGGVLLIVGGLYILRRLTQGDTWETLTGNLRNRLAGTPIAARSAGERYSFEEEENAPSANIVRGWSRPNLEIGFPAMTEARSSALDQVSSPRRAANTRELSEEENEAEWDAQEEDADDWGKTKELYDPAVDDAGAWPPQTERRESGRAETNYPRPSSGVGVSPSTASERTSTPPLSSPASSPPSSPQPTSLFAPSTTSGGEANRKIGEWRPVQTRSSETRTGEAIATRSQGGRLVGSFECTYQMGDSDYEESHSLLDAALNRYIGECGMGVSSKNRIVHKDASQVIALEVWLFDKSDERNIVTQMRVLLSEYASDHYTDVFLKERNGESRPFVAQPGTPFQLEGRHLVLNGEVVDVAYTREGIFQTVTVRMNIIRK